MPVRPVTRRRRLAPTLLAAIAALVLVEVAVNVVTRPQEGPPALAAVLETYLLAAGAAAGLLAILTSLGSGSAGAWIRLVGAAMMVVAVVRLGGEWWSPTPTVATGTNPAPIELRVMTWNLAAGSRSAADTVAGISGSGADLVALQELTPDVATAIGADPALRARYPYRILEAQDGTEGLGLLSRLPLVTGGYSVGPPVLRAGLLLQDGRSVQVLDAHPIAPDVMQVGAVPVGLDTRQRDTELQAIRDAVAALPDPGAALVLGDLNLTPFEPGYGMLTGGSPGPALADAHEAVGTGTGFTWRPSSLEGLKIGLLRIDHVLSGAWLRPIAVREDCALPGDHCRLLVTMQAVPAASGG